MYHKVLKLTQHAEITHHGTKFGYTYKVGMLFKDLSWDFLNLLSRAMYILYALESCLPRTNLS